MSSDQQVSARAVLRAVTSIERNGHQRALEQLEQLEPDLTAYLWESLSAIHRSLLSLGGPPKHSRRLYRRIQATTLVCITALREGHYELWQQSPAGQVLELDESSTSPESQQTQPPST